MAWHGLIIKFALVVGIPYRYSSVPVHTHNIGIFLALSTPSCSASDPDPQVTQRPSARPNQASASVSAAIALAMERWWGRGASGAVVFLLRAGPSSTAIELSQGFANAYLPTEPCWPWNSKAWRALRRPNSNIKRREGKLNYFLYTMTVCLARQN
jgi:hypothetical protein